MLKSLQCLIVMLSFLLLAFQCGTGDSDILEGDGKGGSITRFAVHQGYMYALNQNEVQTFSLQNPDKPLLVHRLATDYGLETIIIYDNTIFIGSTTALYILSIENPAAPVLLSKTPDQINIGGRCDPVVVKGNYAYSTAKIIQNICGNVSSQSALLTYDVTDKTRPKLKSFVELNLPNGLGYKDNLLFVCDEGFDKVLVFDIAQPDDPQPTNLDFALTDPIDLIVDGQKMIVSTRSDFYVFDLSDPQNIRKIGQIAR
jgi:hypothetical protein